VAASLIIVAHFRTDARLRREANPTIPAACIAPPNLSTEASTVFSGLTITDAQSVATVIANRIRAANFASSAVGVYVSDQTAAQHNTSIDPALGQHDPGLNNVATASLGTSPDLVYEITTVEQFDTAAQAIAYNQRIYEVRCEEHQNPTITPDPLGTFMLPQCTCTTGGGYSEMSTVVGPFRVGMDDYATNRTPQQLQALTEEALAST
jgi:hypothetical protein